MPHLLVLVHKGRCPLVVALKKKTEQASVYDRLVSLFIFGGVLGLFGVPRSQ